MGALREKMIEEIRLRNFSPRTEHSYVSAMVGLAKYYRQSPDQLSQEQIRAYLLHLRERGLSPSSRNVAISGMKFFYQQCLGWNEKQLFIPPRKRSWQLPEVLSQKEVERLLLAATTQRDRCLLMTAYATGLRVSELVRLKVSAIDSHRMMVRVEQGKGRKDRTRLYPSGCSVNCASIGRSIARRLICFPIERAHRSRSTTPRKPTIGRSFGLALKKGTGFIRSGTVLLLIFWKPGWI